MTQMTLVFTGKGLVLEGWSPKIESTNRFQDHLTLQDHLTPLGKMTCSIFTEFPGGKNHLQEIPQKHTQTSFDCWHQNGNSKNIYAPRSLTASLPLKNDGWEMILYFWVPVTFQGSEVLNFRWVHSLKLTCPLKRDYFNRKYIFQPSIFRVELLNFRWVQ